MQKKFLEELHHNQLQFYFIFFLHIYYINNVFMN